MTIDEIQQYIINILQDYHQRGELHSNPLSRKGYDVYLTAAVTAYIGPQDIYIEQDYQTRMSQAQHEKNCHKLFADALWDFCRKGIMRPGVEYQLNSTIQEIDEGFAITEYGENWLSKYGNNALLPANPDRFTQLFNDFQPLFGRSYFQRAKEAVSCFQVGTYLACCVMCGAATKSILLAAAFVANDQEMVLKKYKGRDGRREVEKMLFTQAGAGHHEQYKKYTDLIKYWRDETGHGHETDIDVNEAYIAMLTLLRFAAFMRDNWNEITV